MPRNHNPLRAVFDVRPVNEHGSLDLSKIESIQAVINLAVAKNVKANPDIDWQTEDLNSNTPLKLKTRKTKAEIMAQDPEVSPRLAVHQELEGYFKDADASLIVSLGGSLHKASLNSKPKRQVITPRRDTRISLDDVARHINERDLITHTEPLEITDTREELVEAPSQEIELAVADAREIDLLISNFHRSSPPKALHKPMRSFNIKKIAIWSIVAIALAWGLYAFGSGLKYKVTQDGESAVASLEAAEENIKNLDFQSAGENFANAYEQFSKAGEDINFLGASLGSLIAEIPGAGKLKSANSIVKIGKLFADTGSAMAKAMESLSSAASLFGGESIASPTMAFASMTDALAVARANMASATALAEDIDVNLIPEERRAEFQSILSSLPLFRQTVNQAFDYSKFLERLAGVYGSKKYLILFENQSELRPTGGFPGTYALVTFQSGVLKDFKVDDVYNIDGQLKENIIPPKQLQHITPTWGMRDVNWFLDFPTSARKIMEFYKKESSLDVDGVIAINPEVVSRVIKIVGPIQLPKYGLILDENNFIPKLQEEVEYGKNRTQPKTVMVDFATQLLEQVRTVDSSKLPEIFSALSAGMGEKNALMYFKDLYLERFAIDNNFGGQIVDTKGDYLMVTFSNVKGSKTDRVTDTAIDMESELKDGKIFHTLTITRKHNGGDNDLEFYNKVNPSFVRMLVPEGSELISVSGNDNPSYTPIINYSKSKFSTDPDLARLEATFKPGANGEYTYSESGKTGFAFWMVNKPKETKSIVIKYSIPQNLVSKDYSLYVQKQPGLVLSGFDFTLFSSQAFAIKSSTPLLSNVSGRYSLNSSLKMDLPISIEFE